MESCNVEFPKNGDVFFTKGFYENEAYLPHFLKSFSMYANGYREGAIKLMDAALQDKPMGKISPVLTYPIVFLVRHYTELILKHLIGQCNYCLFGKEDYPKGHKINDLWKTFFEKYTCNEMGLEFDDVRDELETMKKLLDELIKIDEYSMAFRYPDANLELEIIDIKNFKEVFIRFSHFLDSTSDLLSFYEDS